MKDLIRMNQLAGLITENQAQKMLAVLNEAEDFKVGEMKIFDLKDENGKSTELFKIENFSSVEDAINMLNKYYNVGEDEVDSFYTNETGTGYNYVYIASDGSTRFVKSLEEFSGKYKTLEGWGVAPGKEKEI
jgi:hypothetical protein